jgi:hypothetical protein
MTHFDTGGIAMIQLKALIFSIRSIGSVKSITSMKLAMKPIAPAKPSMRFIASIGFAFFSFVSLAHAEKTYELTGNVQKISDDRLIVERNGETFEFALGGDGRSGRGGIELKKKPKVGEQVTVKYSLDLENLVIQKKPKQLPGQVDPFKHIIEDDRIFYEAQKSQDDPNSNETEKS